MKSNFESEKKRYQQIPIPDQLPAVIHDAMNHQTKKPRFRVLRYTTGGIAACFLAFVLCVNTSTVFAESVYDIPIIGDFARIITFSQYQTEDEVKIVNVEIPAIQNTGNTEFEKEINQQIYDKMNQLVEESKQIAQEYYDAFLETGGKKEDFLPVDIIVDYEVKQNDKNTLSFIVTRFIGFASAYTEKFYYNIDLKNDKMITLQDLLGENYKEIANRQIQAAIDLANQTEDSMFFKEGDLSNSEFKSIQDNQNFYINQDGKPVVVFDKYEIAAGAAGFPEFVIEPA